METKESCRVVVMSQDHHHHRQGGNQLSSSSSSSSCSGGFDGGGGPFFNSRSDRFACYGDIYDVVGGGGGFGCSGSDSDAVMAVGSKSMHSFSPPPNFNFNFSGGEMRASSSPNVRVPFTAAQWQELERQTIIYKYMMASVPVPPELLIPITKTLSNTSLLQSHVSLKSSLELGISNSDPEPWRCKRTDGKKWRCSRDVAPEQKYCERHSHKSRPRSRKPVELHTDSMASRANTTNYLTNSHLLNQKSHFTAQTNSHLSIYPGAIVSAANSSYDHQPRTLEWFLKGETVSVPRNSNQEWQYLKQDKIKGCNEKPYSYRGQLHESNSYAVNLRGDHNTNTKSNSHSLQAHRLNDNCSLLLSPNSTTLNPSIHTQTQEAHETRHFLDAWSSSMREGSSTTTSAICNDQSSVSLNGKILPLSTLTLSMSGTIEGNENGNGQASSGFGIMTGSADKESMGGLRSHGSWMGGGPLAEALCLGFSNSTRADSVLASSHGSTSGFNF